MYNSSGILEDEYAIVKKNYELLLELNFFAIL